MEMCYYFDPKMLNNYHISFNKTQIVLQSLIYLYIIYLIYITYITRLYYLYLLICYLCMLIKNATEECTEERFSTVCLIKRNVIIFEGCCLSVREVIYQLQGTNQKLTLPRITFPSCHVQMAKTADCRRPVGGTFYDSSLLRLAARSTRS